MKLATTAKVLATGLALLMLVFEVTASDPIFVKWLVVDDPGDETIRVYWQRAEAGELSAPELVDLGTMLFYRGWPNDAVGYFKQAQKLDPKLSEAWFRMGLVEHYNGDLAAARSAYRKCLKLQSGHAWANFYLGLLEEQTGDASAAMKHFETAFQHAPELANPRINPEILSSKLQLGAQVQHFDRERFEKMMPMPFLDPAAVRKTEKQFEKASAQAPAPIPEVASRTVPTPESAGSESAGSEASKTRRPEASRSGAAAAGGTAGSASRASKSRSGGGSGGTTDELPDAGSTPYGVPEHTGTGTGAAGAGATAPRIGDTSPEASLRPLWPGLYEIVSALI